MSKTRIQTRCPNNLETEIAKFKEQNGIEKDSEAVRQLLERGVEKWQTDEEEKDIEPPGETLMRQASTISIVLAVVSGMLIVMPGGPAWSVGAAMAGVASTTIFGTLWLGVRAIAGRGDWV